MTSRADSIPTPECLTGVALRIWNDYAPELWAKGLLTEEHREAITQGCEDWKIHSEYVRGPIHIIDEDGNPALRPENRAAHEAFGRWVDFAHNYGLTPMGRLAMEQRGGTVGDRLTPPDDYDDDPAATAQFMAELRRSLFQVHDGEGQ